MGTAITNVKAKVATSITGNNDELESLCQQVANLLTLVKSTQFNGNGNKNKRQSWNQSSKAMG